jgi:hypothetical protein
MFRFMSIVLTSGLLMGIAFAHGGNEHIAGTVAAIEGDHVTVKTPAGKTVMVMIDAKTKYLKDKATVTKADLAPGTRVVIDAKMDAKLKMYTASEVRLGVAAPAAKAASAPAAKKTPASTPPGKH